MRTDEELSHSVRACEHWKLDLFGGESLAEVQEVEDPREDSPQTLAKSFSGHERNRLFLNRGGDSFTDISGISGADALADGRALAVWDYDRDGWNDIALVNANAPLLQLFRNEIGRSTEPQRPAGQMIAVRFVGGNHTPFPADEFSARDGYGAVVTVTGDDMSLLREHRCGEGFAAQNSDTMIIGLGEHQAVARLAIRWPAGTTSELNDVPAGVLITVFEDPTQSPDGSGFVSQSYVSR